MEIARRLEGLDSAIFSEMDELRVREENKGKDIINLSIGSPDLPPPPHVVQALQEAVANTGNYGYALTKGIKELREAVAGMYRRRFDVFLDPDREVLSLMGSQDGLAHIYLAVVNPGDVALVPDPGYPIYSFGIHLAGGEKYAMPLVKENDFLPDLTRIPEEIAWRAKIMVLNYPNNPNAAVAPREFFEEVVAFAKKYDILVCHDIAYSELAFDGYRPISFLSIPGAKDIGVEFYSLSKTYNMAGCRLGFIVGNSTVIKALETIKSNIDYGVFLPVQQAGIAALTGPQDWVESLAQTYARRRDVLVDGLNKIGWQVDKPKASMFVWAAIPPGFKSSKGFAVDLLKRTGVVVVPGAAFGKQGDRYVRIALVCPEQRLQEAVERIARHYHLPE